MQSSISFKHERKPTVVSLRCWKVSRCRSSATTNGMSNRANLRRRAMKFILRGLFFISNPNLWFKTKDGTFAYSFRNSRILISYGSCKMIGQTFLSIWTVVLGRVIFVGHSFCVTIKKNWHTVA